MFSIMTIASSTTKPVPMVSAISDRLSRLNPQKYITAKVAMSDTGSATPAMMVARPERRNTSTTMTINATLSTRVNCTSWIEARMVSVRSCTVVSLTFFGSARSMRGSSAFRRSTVSMTLAPGWRCTSMITAGVPWYQPPTRAFSRPSLTSATSLRRTGAELR